MITEESAVLAANAAFYRAMRLGDLALMESLWARGRTVICTHPSGPSLVGLDEVLSSWRLILSEGGMLPITHRGARAIVTGGSAMVLCTEIIGEVHLMATKTFVYEDARWRLLNHEAAPVPGTVG